MPAAIATLVLAALVAQLGALWKMGTRRPVGDEKACLARGLSPDPYAPRQFLRPPLLPWLSAVCHRGGGNGESRLRLLMAVASFLTVALTAIAGWRLGGPEIALLASLLLAVQPERILIGCHIWPESVLAFLLAALLVAHTLPATPALALAAGCLCILGVLTRIDFVVAPPLLLAAWWTQGPPAAITTAALLAPPIIALVWISLRNGRRYGIPLPDTTWAFNLMVASREPGLDGSRPFEIERAILAARTVWLRLRPTQAARRGRTALLEILRSPRDLGRGIVRRLLTLVGPDTFVRQRLLPTYTDLGPPARRRWDAALEITFPVLVTTLLIAAAVDLRLPASFAWPSLGMMTAALLFHARTRFRTTALPALSLLAAQGITGLVESLPERPLTAILVVIAAPLLLWALLRIRCSTEVDDPA